MTPYLYLMKESPITQNGNQYTSHVHKFACTTTKHSLMQDPRADMKSSSGLKILCLALNRLSLPGYAFAFLLNDLLSRESNSLSYSGVSATPNLIVSALSQAIVIVLPFPGHGLCFPELKAHTHSSFWLLRGYCVKKLSTTLSKRAPSEQVLKMDDGYGCTTM